MYIELAYPEQQRTLDGTGKLTEAVIQYLVFEVLDEAEALAYAFQEVPKELEDLKLLSVTISERKSKDIFLIEVSYGVSSSSSGSDDDEDEEEATVNFDCTTGSGHVTSALKNFILYQDEKKIDPGNAIGWNGKTGDDSEVSGVEKMVPTLTETYTKVMRVSQLNNAFRRKVAGLTTKINSKSFKGWDRGEALFLGCSFTAPEKNAEKVTVSFHFAIRLNEKSEIEGHGFTKDGWCYVWTISKPEIKNGKPAVDLTGIYGSRVYEYADFGALGL